MASEAEKAQLINQATGAAEAVILAGEARAKSIQAVASVLDTERGANAASLAVAENYVKAFGNLAKSSNTLLLPSNVGDVSGMVTQAMAIFKKLDHLNTNVEETKSHDDIQDETISDNK